MNASFPGLPKRNPGLELANAFSVIRRTLSFHTDSEAAVLMKSLRVGSAIRLLRQDRARLKNMANKADQDQIDVFNRDAASNSGYIYTTNTQLSSQMATQRSTEVIAQLGAFAGRTVLDVGCGDGYYTCRLYDLGQPLKMIGVDLASKAVEIANSNKGNRNIEFQVGDAHRLPYADNSFDMVLVQSILHHDDNPLDLIREAFRLAPEILIHEPNGNNLGLKIIEKVSRYHREHHEKSYSSRRLRNWIKEAKGQVIRRQFAGFVPMFCSDSMARFMKGLEPAVERLHLVNTLGCAVQVVVAARES